jgi:pro-apoptotic serine protease NMA111
MKLARRNDRTGLWDFSNTAELILAQTPTPVKASFIQLDSTAVTKIIQSSVRVSCTIPLRLDGFHKNYTTGFGVVVDASAGLVCVSRAIIPHSACNVNIIVADSIEVGGEVVFLHPFENYALLKYNPDLVQAPVKSAQLSAENMKLGQATIFVGLTDSRVVFAKATVTDIATTAIPENTSTPRYHAINPDFIDVDTSLSYECPTGVLINEDGIVQALWLNYLGRKGYYHRGFATPSLLPIVSQIQQGHTPKLRTLDVEWDVISMDNARTRKVSEEWIQRVVDANLSRHQLFMVRKLHCHPPLTMLANNLLPEDIILTIQGHLITTISELYKMYDFNILDMVIMRNGQQMQVKIHTVPTEDLETDHIIKFCGANFQKPHYAVRQQSSKLYSEIWVDFVVCSCCILTFLRLTSSLRLKAHLLGYLLFLLQYLSRL